MYTFLVRNNVSDGKVSKSVFTQNIRSGGRMKERRSYKSNRGQTIDILVEFTRVILEQKLVPGFFTGV